jgi:hypothetical protein
MNRSTLFSVLKGFVFFVAAVIYGCGGGGGGGGAPVAVGGGGVKGPLANAVVTVYAFDATAAGFKGGVVDTGSTDASAQITGLSLPFPLNPPYIMEFTSTAGTTTDITTGAFPVITTMRTVITQALLDGGEQIYATPLTTMATDLAIANADSNTAPWGGDGDSTTSAAELVAALPVAASQVASTLGFGASSSVDIFDTPPLVDDTTDTGTEQQSVAEYRAAVEAVTAVVYQMDQQSSGTTPDQVLSELTSDLVDGQIDGNTESGASTILTTGSGGTLEVLDQEPSQLPIPGTNLTVADIETIITNETSTTGTTTTVDNTAIAVTMAPAETNPDRDSDGVPNVSDAFPDDATESVDTDSDGIGNNADSDDDNDGVADGSDAFPLDSTEHTDTDSDGTGNNADDNDDGDSAPDATDDFPLDATRQTATDQDSDGWPVGQDPDDAPATGAGNPGTTFVDTDGDGLADSGGLTPDADDDNDGVADGSDAFPLNASETADMDGDCGTIVTQTTTSGNGCGDNSDTDIDGDGTANGSDAFPRNAAETTDTDNDGVGNVADTDDDNDGVSDTQEGIDGTNPLLRDTDGDGVLDNADAFPLDNTESKDTDGDTTGDNADTDDDNDGLQDSVETGTGTFVDANDTGTKSLVADTDGDSLNDGAEVAAGTSPVSTDSDGDGDLDNADNCPINANADQADSNNNGKGDVCEGAPTAVDDMATTDEDTAVTTVDVTANDTDPESDTLTVAGVDAASAQGGAVVNNNDGTFTYTPAANFNGSDTFTYTVTDGTTGVTDSGTVTVTVNAINDAPTAADVAAGVQPGASTSIDLTSSISDIDGDNVTITDVTGATLGTPTINGSSIDYVAGSAEGTDTLTYTVSDGVLTASGSITVTVVSNQSPAPGNVTLTLDEDASATTVDVVAAATDAESDPITLQSADTTSAQGGTVTNNGDGTFTYTPVANFSGTDSFSYVLSDGNSTATGTVNITVTAINDAPTATDDSANATAGGSAVVIDVLANDAADVDGDTVTVTAVSSVSGTAGGTAVISNNGADVTYTPSATDGTATFTYTADDGNGGTATGTVTVTVASAQVTDASGVWKMTTTLDSQSGSDCDGTLGETDTFYITVDHNVATSAVSAWSQWGDALTGTVDTSGVASLSGTTTLTIPDESNPTDDTATVTESDSISMSLSLPTPTTMTGTATVVDSLDSTVQCTENLSVAATYVYTHSGSEDYNGNYALEIVEETFGANDFGSGVNFFSDSERESWFATMKFDATNGVSVYDPEFDPSQIVSSSFDPNTGYFTMTLQFVEKEDFDGDGTIDETWVDNEYVSGILLRDPTDQNANIDGAPMIAMSILGDSRAYFGDKDSGGTPYQVEIIDLGAYGKQVTPTAYTRTNTSTNAKGDTVNRTMIGLFHPTLETTSATSTLFVEVLDGTGTTTLCSVDYANEGITTGIPGGYKEHNRLPRPDFASEAFSTSSYARAVCDPSSDGSVAIINGTDYVVQVVDTGSDGLRDGNSDTVIYSTTTTATVNQTPFSEGIARSDIKFNGASVSSSVFGTQDQASGVNDRANAIVRGFFDPDEAVTVTWPSHPDGADGYLLRAIENEDFIEYQIGTTGNSVTIPVDSLWDRLNVRLSARKDDANGRALAYSSYVNLRGGVRGQFLIELGNGLPIGESSMYVGLRTDENGLVTCVTPQSSTGIITYTCNSASIDYSTNSVTLNMTDNDGVYTGVAGGSFTLVMTFTDAVNATVTASGLTISGTAAARESTPELFVRTRYYSHNQAQRTHFNFTSAPANLYPRGVIKRADDTALTPNVTSTAYDWYNNTVAGSGYGAQAIQQIVQPLDDGNVQSVRNFIVANTANIDASNPNTVMPATKYKLVLFDSGVTPFTDGEKRLHFFDYAAPDASNYIPPRAGQSEAIMLDTVDCSVSACNQSGAPVSITAQPTVSWPVNASVPAGSYWRISFEDAADPQVRVRTPWVTSGDTGFTVSSGTATWDSATAGMTIPSGTWQVRIMVGDAKAGFNQTVFGMTTGDDTIYVTAP